MSWHRVAIWSAPVLVGTAILFRPEMLAATPWLKSLFSPLINLSIALGLSPRYRTNTLLRRPPTKNEHIALKSFAFCGDTIEAAAYISKSPSGKVVVLRYEDAQGESSPLNGIGLSYNSYIEGTNYELWTSKTPYPAAGVSRFSKLTYDLLDADESYTQQLQLQVDATNGRPPSKKAIPSPYAAPTGLSDDITSWLQIKPDSQIVFAKNSIYHNIDPHGTYPGVLVAGRSGPSFPSKDPDYEYTWVRDTALTFDVLGRLFHLTSDQKDIESNARNFFDYATSRAFQQTQPNLQTGIGEVKFYLNNTIFREPWGRPQNDGPASSVSALTRFARDHHAKGGSGSDKAYLKRRLYDSDEHETAPLKRDLLFVARNWSKSCFDLWEEVSSDHFYTRMVQRRALVEGAKLAAWFDDPATSKELSTAADAVTSSLTQFWDADKKIILCSYGPIMHGKTSYIDVSVILGVLHGWNNDAVFGPTDERILSTALHMTVAFLEAYRIARTTQHDEEGRTLGVPIGRYSEDVYDGYGMAPEGGNPWFLATSAIAELFFLAVREWRKVGRVQVTAISEPFWTYFAPGVKVEVGATYKTGSSEFTALTEAVLGWGDAFLRRVKANTGEGGHLSEQFNRNTGVMQGCEDLTWSYAALISAALARADVSGDEGYGARLAAVEVQQLK